LIVRFLLVHVSTLWLGIGLVVVTLGLSALGLVITRWRVPPSRLVKYQDVAGFVIAVVGVIYAVLLAFVVVIVWEDFGSADTTANDEAVSVGNLYRDAVGVGGAQGARLESAVQSYATSVVEVEWPYMAVHQTGSGETENALNVVWADVKALNVPAGATVQADFAEQAVRDVSTATEDRHSRLLKSQSQIPGTLWAVLLVGAFITITFTYFFALDSLKHQLLMVSALATLIALSLLVILTLNLPYTGDVSVGPEAMHTELQSFTPTMF
jgi:uncharacterized membrane protein YraQ (UPF0718 family)